MEKYSSLRYQSLIRFHYKSLFNKIEYNDAILNDEEKKDTIRIFDEEVSRYCSMISELGEIKETSTFLSKRMNEGVHCICSVLLFIEIVICDSIVQGKYFLLADKDYDKRFMRGKFKILLNEGFKKLYGFKNHEESEWGRIKQFMHFFPRQVQEDYEEITGYLEKESKESSWWKTERDLETHLDAEGLFNSRAEEINESKVMMESLHLFELFHAVNLFACNLFICITNTILKQVEKRDCLPPLYPVCDFDGVETESQ